MINIEKLHKSFGSNEVLRGIDLDVKEKEVVAIIGPSGSGKSTLLRCMNYLEQPTSGMVSVDGIVLNEADINQVLEEVGMVFQRFNLFPHMTVLQNIMLAPLKVRHADKAETEQTASQLLKRVGLADKADAWPNQLSGGQQQRVSIARALVRNPAVILADEPTGALDSHTGREVLGMLQQLHEEGHTVVLITHDNSIAVQADRIIRLEDGRVVYDGDSHAPEAIVQPTLLPETPEKTAEQEVQA